MKTDVLKNGKTKFVTLDSTVVSEDPAAPREEGGLRIEEINNEMSIAMGVSKAILNNVIFCHQEDSNWPLDEGKKLKEKFDSIFGTTDYNKAIDKILKFRKDYQAKLTTSQHEKKFLEEIKRDADKKHLELEMLKQKHDNMKSKSEDLEASVTPLDQRLEKLLEKEKQFGKLQGGIVIYEST